MICIIPARGGSTRIPGKNKKLFFGKPMIERTIEIAEKSGLFNQIIVSTDDEEIAQIAQKRRAFLMIRPADLAQNEVGTQEVMKDCLEKLINLGLKEKVACCIYPCSPLLDVHDLKRGRVMLDTSRKIKYSYSIGPDGQDAGNFYFGYVDAFIEGIPLEGNSITVPLDEDRTQDINTMDDWMKAEKKYGRLHEC